jgi:hypothetical protein
VQVAHPNGTTTVQSTQGGATVRKATADSATAATLRWSVPIPVEQDDEATPSLVVTASVKLTNSLLLEYRLSFSSVDPRLGVWSWELWPSATSPPGDLFDPVGFGVVHSIPDATNSFRRQCVYLSIICLFCLCVCCRMCGRCAAPPST